jgi:orotidine-5'-phosphate decarboxylase
MQAAMAERSAVVRLSFDPADRLIVALDVPTPFEARRLIERLDGVVSTFKIGLQLQLVTDLVFIKRLVASGKRIFLDYKYYDIGRTVREAVAQAADIGVSFLTVHGNGDIIRAAVEGKGTSDLNILSVTVLTSLDEKDIQEMGFACTVQDLVLRRARMAMEAGCDGVIASGQEAKQIREQIGQNLLIVAPGIRPDGEPAGDQKRVTAPAEAISAGADYLVLGRPIYEAVDPASKAEAVIAEMRAAFERRH